MPTTSDVAQQSLCDHKDKQLLASYSSHSAGIIWWCAICGAISITSPNDPASHYDWKLPLLVNKELNNGN